VSNPWKKRVLAFNQKRRDMDEKAADVDVLVQAMLELPPGQLKKLFSEDVLAVLAKYGYTSGE